MSDPVAVITGASRGIGRATTIALANLGYRLALVARTLADLEETARLAGTADALLLPADVTDAKQVADLVKRAAERFGGIDALVNVAGVAPARSIEEMSVEAWREVMDTNLSAVFYLVKYAWPYLKASSSAVVVNVSSMAARDPFNGFAAYGAAKAGLNVLGLVAAREGHADGIAVHTIAPGAVETAMFRQLMTAEQYPTEKTLSPDEVAQAIAQCVSGQLRHTSGEVIYLHKTP